MTTTQMDPAVALADLQATKHDRVTIVLLSGDLDRAMAAFIIATGAAAMGMKVTMKDVKRIGIGGVKSVDVQKAGQNGNAIKLIATCDGRRLEVSPTEVSRTDPICVNGTLNAVTFSSEHSGQQTIIGRGAGGMETASAVLRDLIEIRDTVFER